MRTWFWRTWFEWYEGGESKVSFMNKVISVSVDFSSFLKLGGMGWSGVRWDEIIDGNLEREEKEG